MKKTEQAPGQNIVQHGLKVFQYTNKLLNKQFEDFTLPQWWDEYQEHIYNNLHNFKIIKNYTIFHDCGKHACLEYDSEGKKHFPNHAEHSERIWSEHFPDRTIEARLIRHDMAFHTLSADDILALNLSTKDLCTLLLASLAEIHANADTFYPDEGKNSTWFKIKFKKWSKTAKKICDKLFNHAYMYVLVRKDLNPRQTVVQTSHAAIESARHYLQPDDEHPSVIVCSVKSEQKLLMCADELKEQGIGYQLFREPDLNNQYTALASRPLRGAERNAFSRFQLLQGD